MLSVPGGKPQRGSRRSGSAPVRSVRRRPRAFIRPRHVCRVSRGHARAERERRLRRVHRRHLRGRGIGRVPPLRGREGSFGRPRVRVVPRRRSVRRNDGRMRGMPRWHVQPHAGRPMRLLRSRHVAPSRAKSRAPRASSAPRRRTSRGGTRRRRVARARRAELAARLAQRTGVRVHGRVRRGPVPPRQRERQRACRARGIAVGVGACQRARRARSPMPRAGAFACRAPPVASAHRRDARQRVRVRGVRPRRVPAARGHGGAAGVPALPARPLRQRERRRVGGGVPRMRRRHLRRHGGARCVRALPGGAAREGERLARREARRRRRVRGVPAGAPPRVGVGVAASGRGGVRRVRRGERGAAPGRDGGAPCDAGRYRASASECAPCPAALPQAGPRVSAKCLGGVARMRLHGLPGGPLQRPRGAASFAACRLCPTPFSPTRARPPPTRASRAARTIRRPRARSRATGASGRCAAGETPKDRGCAPCARAPKALRRARRSARLRGGAVRARRMARPRASRAPRRRGARRRAAHLGHRLRRPARRPRGGGRVGARRVDSGDDGVRHAEAEEAFDALADDGVASAARARGAGTP